MVHQSSPITKLSRFLSRFKPVRVKQLAPLALALLFAAPPAEALVRMTNETINLALLHGMKNGNASYSALLGPNWVEGPHGSLLNVYSPYMMLATKAAGGGFPERPTDQDLQDARKRYGKYVSHYTDPKFKMQVKFAVSLYGRSPEFANHYKARIVGFGRGKEFDLKPYRVIYDKIADDMGGGDPAYQYAAVNSYYFLYKDLQDLQDFQLVLEDPNGSSIVFPLHNSELY